VFVASFAIGVCGVTLSFPFSALAILCGLIRATGDSPVTVLQPIGVYSASPSSPVISDFVILRKTLSHYPERTRPFFDQLR
jgi:hypothetical protein